MSSRLVVDISEKQDSTYVRISGIINEDNNLAEFIKKINQQTIIVNTANVDRINSCGVRDWVNWLNELDRKGADIYFVECSPVIVSQINLVNNFIGSGTIISFYAPYFCDSCDTDKMLLIEIEEVRKTIPFKPPTCRCNQCDHVMEFDEIETSYFAFISTIKKQAITSEIAKKINQFTDENNPCGKLRARTLSIPLQTNGGDERVPSQVQAPLTLPSSMDLKDLLSKSSSFPSPQFNDEEQSSSTNKFLFLIVGLLVVAVGLLGYVVIRAS